MVRICFFRWFADRLFIDHVDVGQWDGFSIFNPAAVFRDHMPILRKWCGHGWRFSNSLNPHWFQTPNLLAENQWRRPAHQYGAILHQHGVWEHLSYFTWLWRVCPDDHKMILWPSSFFIFIVLLLFVSTILSISIFGVTFNRLSPLYLFFHCCFNCLYLSCFGNVLSLEWTK